jgi:hypothetical protein
VIGQPREHVGEPRLRIDVVELCGLDQCIHGGGAPAPFVGAGERPVVASDGDAAQRPLAGIVGDAQPAVIEEASEHWPAPEAIIDCLGSVALG